MSAQQKITIIQHCFDTHNEVANVKTFALETEIEDIRTYFEHRGYSFKAVLLFHPYYEITISEPEVNLKELLC